MALTDDVALIDDVSRSYWTKMLMWQYVSGLKNVRTIHVYTWNDGLDDCSIQSELATCRNPERPNCLNSMAMIYSLYL